MPISTEDLAKLRTPGMHTTRPVVNFIPANIIATGTIATTPTIYPIGEVDMIWDDSNWNNIKVGQLFIVRDAESGSLVTYGVVRLSATSNKLFIDAKSRGDSGKASSIRFGLTGSTQTVTVYQYRPLWALLSRISNNEFFKKFDQPYDQSGSLPNPVCNLGPWRQQWVNETTGVSTITFDASSSYGHNFTDIDNYTWVIPDSATNVIGDLSGANASQITFDLPEGYHEIECTVVSNVSGITTLEQTSWRPIWINGPNFLPANEQYGMLINSDSQDMKGRNTSFSFYGDIDESIFLPGLAFHMTEEADFGGQQLNPNTLVTNFAGFAGQDVSITDRINGDKQVNFEVFGPWRWFENIPMVSQAIVEVDGTPAAWTDIRSPLGNVDFITWYILKHHTTYLNMFDYNSMQEYIESNPPRKRSWGLNGNVVADYINQIAASYAGFVGCASDGSLFTRRDPNLEDLGYRILVDNRMTITVDETVGISDITENVEYPETFFNSVGQIRVFSLMFDGADTTAFGSIAPGYTQQQAPGSSDQDSLIVKPPGSQDPWERNGQEQTNIYCGHVLARENNPTPEISLKLNRNMDVFDPAKVLWSTLSIPASWNPRGGAINIRVLPKSVDRAWEEIDGAWVKTITLNVAPETFGQPGETYNIDTGAGGQYEPLDPPQTYLDEFSFNDPINNYLGGFLIAVDNFGNLGRTFDGEFWESIMNNVVGRCEDFVFDQGSSFVTGGFASGFLGCWMIVATRRRDDLPYETVQIWYTQDILGEFIEWDLQFSLTSEFQDFSNACRILQSEIDTFYVAATAMSVEGNRVIRSGDGGNSWSVSIPGGSNNSAFLENRVADAAFRGNRLITSGYSSVSGGWVLYHSSSVGGNWTEVNNCPVGNTPWPNITADPSEEDLTVYATKLQYSILEDSFTLIHGVNDTGDEIFTTTHPDSTVAVAYVETDFRPDAEPQSNIQDSTAICASFAADLDAYFQGSGTSPDENTPLDHYANFNMTIRGKARATQARIYGRVLPPCDTAASANNILTVKVNDNVVFATDPDSVSADRLTDDSFLRVISIDSDNSSNVTVVDFCWQIFGQEGQVTPFATIPWRIGPIGWEGFSVSMNNIELEDSQLYKIDVLTGNATFDELEPFNDPLYPVNPYGLSIDKIDKAQLYAVLGVNTQQASGKRIAESSSSGSSWSSAASPSNNIYGINQTGGYGLAWGEDSIIFTPDSFETTVDLYTTWRLTFNYFDELVYIKLAKAIL